MGYHRAKTVVTRFAPSPTGLKHLGNARTALFNYLYAARHGGRFLVRSEDTDLERSDERFLDQILDDLGWLGLAWQEGPDRGGPGGGYRQSERVAIYEEHFERLAKSGETFACFCSSAELKLARKAQLAQGKPPRYPGTCRALPEEEVSRRVNAGQIPSIRFHVDPAHEDIVFDDLVRGEQRCRCEDIGDFVIRRSTGSAAFFFSNALDDALMGVTHVLRGEDHLTNTPRQMLLLEALGFPAPSYGHVALLIAQGGAPLSKRAGARSMGKLRSEGFLALAVVNHLARLGHSYANNELLDIAGLASGFELTRLSRSPAHHDTDHLLHWQREALMKQSDAEFWGWLDDVSGGDDRAKIAGVPDARRAALAAAIRPNVLLPGDAYDWIERLEGPGPEPDNDARAAIGSAGEVFFEHALAAQDESGDGYRDFVAAVRNLSGRRGPELFKPLRAALTGTTHGPELSQVFEYLGADQVRTRLVAARRHCV